MITCENSVILQISIQVEFSLCIFKRILILNRYSLIFYTIVICFLHITLTRHFIATGLDKHSSKYRLSKLNIYTCQHITMHRISPLTMSKITKVWSNRYRTQRNCFTSLLQRLFYFALDSNKYSSKYQLSELNIYTYKIINT